MSAGPGLAAAPTPRTAPLTRPRDEDLDLLLLIRHFELALLALFSQGLVSGTTHTCLGQEYVPVALYPLLDEADFVFSNHRGHGHYLARHRDPAGLLAEITGRQGAVCHGVGGSQHILRGRYLSTGVQGQSTTAAVGVALHLARTEPGRIAVVHIGDGTWGEGAVYEALNLARLWRLPLLVAVENNGIAQTTDTARQMAGTIAARAAAFGVPAHRYDSRDVNVLREELEPVVRRCGQEREPQVVEFLTHRLGPHSKGDDTRPAEAVERLRAGDWHSAYRDAEPERFTAAEERARGRVARLVRETLDLPPSVWEDR